MWRVNNLKDVHESQEVNLLNAKESEILYTSSSLEDQSYNVIPINKTDTLFWEYKLIRATIKHEFDISNFPFDNENLDITLEEDIYSAQDLYLKVDSSQSGLSKILKIQNWTIEQLAFKPGKTSYSSSFGNPVDSSPLSYADVTFTIPIKRDSSAMFWKLLSGLFVAFTISLFSLRININEADARFATCVGGLFASIANMYIVNSNLPMVSQFTFLDELHIMTFFFILLLFVTSTTSLRFHMQGKDQWGRKLDTLVFYGLMLIYLVTVLVLIP